MNKLLFGLLFFIAIGYTSAQEFQFTNSHTALHVKDVSKSASFYTSILGLSEMETPEGIPDTTRWFLLYDKTEIHLIQSEELVDIPKGIHISFATPELGRFIEHLETNNIHYENWWGHKKTTNKRGDGVRQIYLQDPDGYWIEINDGVK